MVESIGSGRDPDRTREFERLEAECARLKWELDERRKELNCLYSVSRLVETPGITLESIFQGVADLIPDSWQLPHLTCVRITLAGQEFSSQGFRESERRQESEIRVHGRTVGRIEVCLLDDVPEGFKPFLPEEESLLKVLSERIGRVSEHFDGEAALRNEETRRELDRQARIHQATIDRAHTHLVYLDRDFNFVAVNAAYAATCRRSPEELIGRNHFELYPNPENEAIFRKVRDTADPISFHDKPFEFPDQPERGVTYWDWTLTPVMNPEGDVEGLVFSLVETTERKRTEEGLRSANLLLDSVRSAQSRYIQDEDPQPVFDYLLETLVELTGSEFGFLDEVLYEPNGTPYKLSLALSNIAWDAESARLYEELRARHLEFRNLNNLSGCPALTREAVIANDAPHDPRSGGIPPGHPAILSFLGLPVRSGDELVGVIGVANRPGGYDEGMASFLEPYLNTCASIIQAIRLRDRQREAEKTANLLEKSESLRRMAGAVAHHYNNLLAAVTGNLELALEQVPQSSEEAAELADALEASHRAARVGSTMLAYLGEMIGKWELMDLSRVVRQTILELDLQVPGDAELLMDLLEPGPVVRLIPDQLREACRNLLVNAWESLGGRAGSVVVRTSITPWAEIPSQDCRPVEFVAEAARYACLEVADTGCGVEEEDLEKLFDPFYSTKFTGRGLGLPVVLGAARAHRGCVVVESEPGVGTSIRVFLPIPDGD